MYQGHFSFLTFARVRVLAGLLLSVSLLGFQAGCINTMVMVSKVLLGDPVQKSGFETATGISLVKEKKRLLIRCSAPAFLSESHGTLTADVEEELMRRLKRHKISVVDPNEAAHVLDRNGGSFNPQLLAREVSDVDYIVHVQVEHFSHIEESSPNFYRGNAKGRIVGYEVRDDESGKHAVQVFDQNFHSTYPTTYPMSVESIPKNVFIRRFTDRLADNLGASFYDVNRSELYAN